MDDLHRKIRIGEGNQSVKYACGCSSELIIPFDYVVMQELVEHSGQGVDGCATESVYIKSNIQEMAQCKDCGRVYQVKMEKTIFEDPRDSKMNLRTGEVIEKADMSLRYKTSQLEHDLKQIFNSVTLNLLGIPSKI